MKNENNERNRNEEKKIIYITAYYRKMTFDG